jgi:hypothetical protein
MKKVFNTMTPDELYKLGKSSEGEDLGSICTAFARKGFLLPNELEKLGKLLQKLSPDQLAEIADDWMQQAKEVSSLVSDEYHRRGLMLPS